MYALGLLQSVSKWGLTCSRGYTFHENIFLMQNQTGYAAIANQVFLISAPKHRLWVLVRTDGEAVLT